MAKCRAFSKAVKDDHARSDRIFGSYYRDIKCKLYQVRKLKTFNTS